MDKYWEDFKDLFVIEEKDKTATVVGKVTLTALLGVVTIKSISLLLR